MATNNMFKQPAYIDMMKNGVKSNNKVMYPQQSNSAYTTPQPKDMFKQPAYIDMVKSNTVTPKNLNAENTGTANATIVANQTPKEPTYEERLKAESDRLRAENERSMAKYQAEQEALKQSRIQGVLNNLRNQYNKAISDISYKRTQLDPTYEAKKNLAASQSQVMAKNFAEFLAMRGLSRSGFGQQQEMIRNLGLQKQFGQYEAQKQAEADYLNRMEMQAGEALRNDEARAMNEAETNYLDNFAKYREKQDAEYRTALANKETAFANEIQAKKEEQKKAIEAEEKKKAENLKYISEQEMNTYGFNLTPLQREQKNKFETAMQKPEFAKLYYDAYNAPGGIQNLINQAKQTGNTALEQALEGGRFVKVLTEGLTQYGGQYGLPVKWSEDVAKRNIAQANAIIQATKSNFEYELNKNGLQEIANKVKLGQLDIAEKELKNSVLPDFLKQDYLSKLADIKYKEAQAKVIPIDAETRRQSMETQKASVANTAYDRDRNYKLNVLKNEQSQTKYNNSLDEKAYKDLDNYILNFYTSNDKFGNVVFSQQNVNDIRTYLNNIEKQGVSPQVVSDLRAKYNVNIMP